MRGGMHGRRAAVQRELNSNGYRMSPSMKGQLHQEEVELERQISALNRRLADAAAADVPDTIERDRSTNLDEWAASSEARAGGSRTAGASTGGEVAACAGVEIPPGAPAWLMLMPAGQPSTRDGRRWRLTDADAVISAIRANAGSLGLRSLDDGDVRFRYTDPSARPTARSLRYRACAALSSLRGTCETGVDPTMRSYSLNAKGNLDGR